MVKMFDISHPTANEALAHMTRCADGPERLTCLRLEDETMVSRASIDLCIILSQANLYVNDDRTEAAVVLEQVRQAPVGFPVSQQEVQVRTSSMPRFGCSHNSTRRRDA